jgi:myo-inositol-1(or 4)-monophosphatase
MFMNTVELEKLTSKVIEIAKEGGAFIRKEAKSFDLSRIEYKGVKDMVSYVDKETENLLVKKLQEIFPEAGFITEEGTVSQSETNYRWIVDPLDGTTNFLHGLPPYSISIALALEKDILLGVVYEINLDECFYAWKSGGAFLNGKKIQVSAINSLENSLIVTGFPYDLGSRTKEYFEIIQHFVEICHGVRRLGSAAVDMCYVACGRVESYFEFNVKTWDIAAGTIIVKEAGGQVSDFDGGDDYFYGKEMLATGKIKDQMIEVIKRYWK